MEFDHFYLGTFIENLKDAASSRSSYAEKDDGMNNPVTKEQFLSFVDRLNGGLEILLRDMEKLEKKVDALIQK